MNQSISQSVIIMDNVIIGDNVTIGENVYIDYGCIIRNNVTIGDDVYIGANCIIGELVASCIKKRTMNDNPYTTIGANSIIRSNTIIYGGCSIDSNVETGHHVTIREYSDIKNHVSIGTLSDIQGFCTIGQYSRLHSNVHIGQKSEIGEYVWIFPNVILTNDPTPPSNLLKGVIVKSFAVITTGAIILPDVTIDGDTLIAAGAVVTKNVHSGSVIGGVPGKKISDITNIMNRIDGTPVYPWRYYFERGMPWEGLGFKKWYEKTNQ